MMFIFFIMKFLPYCVTTGKSIIKPLVVYDGSSLIIFQEMPISLSFSFLLSLKSQLHSQPLHPLPREIQDKFADVLGCVQTGATTPKIVAPTMLGVVACVLAVVCKRMQQLLTMLGSAVHRGKNTTQKSL